MDINRLTEKSQEALHDAQTKALRFGHVEVDGEHLLLALVEQPEGLIPRLFKKMDVAVDPFRTEIGGELEKRPRVSGPGAEADKVYVTQRFNRLLIESAFLILFAASFQLRSAHQHLAHMPQVEIDLQLGPRHLVLGTAGPGQQGRHRQQRKRTHGCPPHRFQDGRNQTAHPLRLHLRQQSCEQEMGQAGRCSHPTRKSLPSSQLEVRCEIPWFP